MVGHVPPGGSDSLEDFNRFYRDLAIEYKDVIVLQVYGHTHKNDFRLVSKCVSVTKTICVVF